MGHVLKHCCKKENCGCDEGQGKCTFEAFETNNLCKFFLSQYSGGGHGTCLPPTESTFRSCDVYRKRPLRALVLLYPLSRQTKFHGLTKKGLFQQTVLTSALRGAGATRDITTPYVFKVQLFFNSISMLEKAIQGKTLMCSPVHTRQECSFVILY